MTRILVTGASGLIGRHLSKKLLKEGHTVVVLTRDFSREYLPTCTYAVQGDIQDLSLLRRVISDYEIETVYHLAAQSIVRICANDPVGTYQANVMGTVNLLEAIRTVGINHIKSIVISTSDKAFGHAPVPYTENSSLMPKYTYECTKACQDIVGQNYFHNYGLPVKIARCSNVYGPSDPNWSRLIPNSIKRILQGESPQLYVDVAEYTREFVYIDDVIDAFQLIDNKALPGSIYCVGGTEPKRIKTLVELILERCNSKLEIEFIRKPVDFKEIKEQFIDGSKIKELGWKPEYSLTTGLEKTIKWYQEELFNLASLRGMQ